MDISWTCAWFGYNYCLLWNKKCPDHQGKKIIYNFINFHLSSLLHFIPKMTIKDTIHRYLRSNFISNLTTSNTSSSQLLDWISNWSPPLDLCYKWSVLSSIVKVLLRICSQKRIQIQQGRSNFSHKSFSSQKISTEIISNKCLTSRLLIILVISFFKSQKFMFSDCFWKMHGIRHLAKQPCKKDLWSHNFRNLIHNTNTYPCLLLWKDSLGFSRTNNY